MAATATAVAGGRLPGWLKSRRDGGVAGVPMAGLSSPALPARLGGLPELAGQAGVADPFNFFKRVQEAKIK